VKGVGKGTRLHDWRLLLLLLLSPQADISKQLEAALEVQQLLLLHLLLLLSFIAVADTID
jgi:hypothetical protein